MATSLGPSVAIFRRPKRISWYCSTAIPRALQSLFGRQQIHRSLGTTDRRLALARAKVIGGKLTLVFERVNQAMNHPGGPTRPDPDIHVLAERWLTEALEELEEDLATKSPDPEDGLDLAITERLEQCELDLRTNRFDMVAEDAKALLNGVTLPPLAYSRFCRELLKVRQTYYQELKQRREGKYSCSLHSPPTTGLDARRAAYLSQRGALDEVAEEVARPPEKVPGASRTLTGFAKEVGRPTKKLTEVFPEYFEAFARRAPKTIAAKRAALDRLVWIIGDKPISDITYEDLQRWRDVLLQLPIHADRNFPGLSVDAILAQVPVDAPREALRPRLGLTTVNGQRKKLSHFFNWCRKPPRKYLVDNPFDGLHLEDAEEQHYDPFTEEDLRILLQSPEFQAQRDLRPDYYWMIFLIAFTGCRLGEVAGLRLDDVKAADGIPYLDIVPDHGQGKRLKTKASRRVVPIHSTLLRLGLLDWIKSRPRPEGSRPASESELAGPKVFAARGGSVSTWWSRLLKAKGIVGKKALHSFRPTLITKLHAAGVDGETRRRLTGHTGKDVHETVYLHAPLTLLREALEKVSLPLVVRPDRDP